MSWFQQNRFLGLFLAVLGVSTLAAAWFIFSAQGSFTEAKARFDENAVELNRLQRLNPFPDEGSLRKAKTQADEYTAEVTKLKEDLKGHVLPVPAAMAPNEFQARLRQVVTGLVEKARANRVKLPENFYLGFDEFAAALPDTAAAPALGQQLAQAELLMNILLDARVESITAFRRVGATDTTPGRPGATPTPSPVARKPGPATAPIVPIVERAVVEAAFVSLPGAARRALNQISTVNEQFYIIRTLHVLNEKDKGPSREDMTVNAEVPPPAPPAGKSPNVALNFIVGNERVQVTSRIEMLRFAF